MLQRLARRLLHKEQHGKEYTLIKRFTQAELTAFTQLTGDTNPIHNVATAKQQCKVPGALLNAIVAGIIGTHLPGAGSVLLEQSYKFPNACRLEVDTEVHVRLQTARKISLVEYVCRQDDKVVLQGMAKILLKQSTK